LPTLGQGILPPQGAVAAELTAITRRAFVPKVVVQLYMSTPFTSAMLASAEVASGGVSPITVPIQGSSMVQGQWIGYDGSFQQPGIIPGVQNAEFDLKGFVTAIPFLGMEGLVQVDYAVVPLIEARMNDATNVTIQTFSNSIYQNITDQTQIIGLPAAIDDGTVSANYGGVSRTTNAFWRSTFVNNANPVAPTRALFLQYIAQVTKITGEKPKMGLVGFGTWVALAQDFVGFERYNAVPGGTYADGGTGVVQALFSAIEVAGVPIYADNYCPEGTLYLLNTDYLSMYIHEKASFYFTGFESTLPNGQFGYLGAILTLLELVNVKPRAHGKFSNLAYANI